MVFNFKEVGNRIPFYTPGQAQEITDTGIGILNHLSTGVGIATGALTYGSEMVHGALAGAKVSVGGIVMEINSREVADLVYDALIPRVAQAILSGRMPYPEDFEHDAIAFIGGPLEGIYVATYSESATLITNGKTPSAEQLGRDMVAALTPVAMRRLGL